MMFYSELAKKYLDQFKKEALSREDRLELAKGIISDGTPTPHVILARLFIDEDEEIREEAKKSILRLKEEIIVKIASDESTHPDLLLFLAKKFHSSPAIGVSIISSKNITEETLWFLQGKGDESGKISKARDIDKVVSPPEVTADAVGDEKEVSKKSPDDDYEVTIEFEDTETGKEDFGGSETYSEDDMEVTIELEEIEKGDKGDIELSTDDGILETEGVTSDEKDVFSSTVDEIEEKFSEVFDVEPTAIKDEGKETSLDFGEPLKYEPDSEYISPPDSDIDTEIIPDVFPDIKGPSRETKKSLEGEVIVDHDRKEVSVATERFVTRLPLGRYFYKVSPWELVEPIVKIAIPVLTVIIILFVLWLSIPRAPSFVEDFESGINRVFVGIKTAGLNSKIDNPFPRDLTISTWDMVKVSEDAEVASGRLKKDMKTFRETHSRELSIDELKKDIKGTEKEILQNNNRIKEIDDSLLVLNQEKDKDLALLSNERLTSNTIEMMYQKEISDFEREFRKIENRVKQIEVDLFDVKGRIAEFEALYGSERTSPGHEANKIELEELTEEYNEIKPEYDELRANYERIKTDTRNKYLNMLNATDNLKEVEKEIKTLNAERARLVFGNEFLNEEVKNYKIDLAKLEKSGSKTSNLKGNNLFIFLVMSHYIVEDDLKKDEDISFLKKYTVLKRNTTLDIKFSGKDKDEVKGEYKATFMRMEIAKNILFFQWDTETTTWVLTSISEVKN